MDLDDGWARWAGDPGVQQGLDELLLDLHGALDALEPGPVPRSAVRAPASSRWRRRRLVRGLAIGTALSVLVGGGAVAAERVLHARTGVVITDPADIAMGGSGKVIRTDADDFVAVARDLTADIPFAPGYERHRGALLAGMYDPEHGPSGISTSALRLTVATTAFCTWLGSWIQERAAGDRSTQQLAATRLGESTGWPAVTVLDPHPDPSGSTDDLGQKAPTLFGWAVPVIAAVRADDPVLAVDRLTDGGRVSPCVTFPLPFVPDREPSGS